MSLGQGVETKIPSAPLPTPWEKGRLAAAFRFFRRVRRGKRLRNKQNDVYYTLLGNIVVNKINELENP